MTSIAVQTDHFIDAFFRENVAYGCDNVMVFESLHPTPFCLEKSSVSNWIF